MSISPNMPIESFQEFAGKLDHPECCAFDREGYLWAGGEAGQIYRIDTGGVVQEVVRTGGFTGGIAFSPGGDLFACNPQHGILRIEQSGRWSVFTHEAAGQPLLEPNYPLFDTEGNLYVTDSGGWKASRGRVLRFDSSGVATELATGLGYANGLALTADESTLFMAESDTNAIYRIRLDGEGAALGAPELYAASAGHVPDGLALDIEGALYVTCYGSHQILRISRLGEISIFAHDPTGITIGGPTNLTFGGDDARLMYVANLARTTIVRARVSTPGLRLINCR
jgi:gluconolactonase